jgi:hypothetical protein|tara:strand:- start:224 stop:409 length:186 start_codon:yes stop_codon:yes gene_type:complete
MGLIDKVKQEASQNNIGVKLSKEETEFLLLLIQESMIPGKKLLEAVKVVEKLQENYKKLSK